jgi:hypothetical protein
MLEISLALKNVDPLSYLNKRSIASIRPFDLCGKGWNLLIVKLSFVRVAADVVDLVASPKCNSLIGPEDSSKFPREILALLREE